MSDADRTPDIEYRSIPTAPGYLFGADGSILSCWVLSGEPYKRRGVMDEGRWHRVKPSLGKRGYYRATLKIDGKPKTSYFHTMILTAFRGPCPAGMECRHLDGNPLNNDVSNLAWGTPKENVADQSRHGTLAVGRRRKCAKLTEEKVREIRGRHDRGERIADLARAYEVNHRAIACVVRRETWRHVL